MATGVLERRLVVGLCLVTFATIANAILVHNSNGEVLYFNTPVMRYGTQGFNITGARLIIAEPVLTFCTANDQDFTDRIVFMGKDGCSPVTKIQVAKAQGAVAIIWADFGRIGAAGNVYWRTWDGVWPDPDQVLPVVTVNQSGAVAMYDLIKNDVDDLLRADLDPYDYNSWRVVLEESDQYLVECILIIAAALAGLGFALSRFVSLLMVQGCSLTTGHFALSFICGGFVTMAIYYIVNIIDIKVGPVAPEAWHMAFVTAPELFSLLACLIVSLYWFELINSVTSRPILFLNKLFKPFIAISVVVVVMWIGINLAAAFFLGDTPFLVFALVYFLVSLMITIIWLIVGIKLLKTVQTNQKMAINKKKKRSFNRLAVCIILCAAFLLNTRMLFIMIVIMPSLGEPENWIYSAGAIFFSQLATLFIQTGLFKMHKRDFKTSGGSDSRGDMSPSYPSTPKGRTGSTLEMSSRTVERLNATKPESNTASPRQIDSVDKSSNQHVSESSSSSETSPREGAAEPNGSMAVEKSEVAAMPEVKAGTEASNNVSSDDASEAQIEVNQHVSESSSSSSSESLSSSDSGSNESYDKTDSSS